MSEVLCGGDGAGVDDRESKAEPDRQESDDDGRDGGERAPDARHCHAHGAHLQDERYLDTCDQQQDEDACGDGDAVLDCRHARVVACEDGVGLVEAAREVQTLQDGPGEVEGETERVEDKDG